MLRSLSFVVGLLFASHAFAAECALPTAPAVPNGASASIDEMKAAQDSVKKFLADTDDFLKCLDFSHVADADTKHDKAVDQMQKLASNFNDQLKAYKAAHPS